MGIKRDSEKPKAPEKRKAKGKTTEDKSADPRAPEAAQAAASCLGSSKTTSGTRTEASNTSQAATVSQTGATARKKADTRATATRTPLPYWGRPHPKFGTVDKPLVCFQKVKDTRIHWRQAR